MPASIAHGVTFLTVLVAVTLIFVGMMASNGRANVPSSAPSSISDSGRKCLDDLSQRANEMEKHNMFLRESVPSLSRIGGHRRSCAFLQGGNCSCNNGAYTFADYEDIEAQILKQGNMNGVKNIQRVKSETACGLQNISHVFNTTHASDALDAAVSIGTVAPGQSRGTGNMLFGERGFITKTFAYLRHVLSAAFVLIAQLRKAVATLAQKLYAADARNAELEANRVDLEAQNKSLMEQLQINNPVPSRPGRPAGGSVYFIQGVGGGCIKIGFTGGHPEQRRKELQTGSPTELKIIHHVKGSRNDEAWAHHHFRNSHSHGEWFWPSRDLMEFIASGVTLSALRHQQPEQKAMTA